MKERKLYGSPSIDLRLFDEKVDVLMASAQGVGGNDPFNLSGYDDGDFI